MNRIFRSELLFLRKSNFTWFYLALFTLVSSIQIVTAFGMIKLGYIPLDSILISLKMPNLLYHYVLPSNIVMGIPLFIFIISIAYGTEYSWGTLKWGIKLGYPRYQVIIGKFAALVVIGMVGCIINTVLGASMGLLINHWLGITINFVFFTTLGTTLIILFFTLLTFWAFGALILTLITISHSPLFSLSIGLLIYLFEYLLGRVVMPGSGPWDYLQPFLLIGSSFSLIFPLEGTYQPIFSAFPIIMILVHGLVWSMIAVQFFKRNDIFC